MRKQLRLITLHHQGLTTLRPFGKGIQATKRAIEHLGYIQIDTLSIVERAHHHTLWTRIPDYQPNYISELVRERSVFEYWFHAASYLPMENFRFVLPQMSAIKRGESPYFINVDAKHIDHVLDRIRIEGPLKARDFKSTTSRHSTWWDWKPAKRALEKLFMQGDLMITRRDGMEKVYDLTERILPDTINTSEPSLLEFAEYLIEVSLKANGFTTLKLLTHLRSGNSLRKALDTILCQNIEEGSLIEYHIDGMPTVYITPKTLDKKLKKPIKNIRILSPFDNAIIHRDKLQQMFDFKYKLECYTPKEKRKFGYFSLPILYNDKLVGRVDCKAHRKIKCLELIHLHLESKEVNLDKFIPDFTKVVNRFAKFNDCHSIRLSNCSPKRLTTPFRKALNSVEKVS
jgi:uncharacterized protein YcaQ